MPINKKRRETRNATAVATKFNQFRKPKNRDFHSQLINYLIMTINLNISYVIILNRDENKIPILFESRRICYVSCFVFKRIQPNLLICVCFFHHAIYKFTCNKLKATFYTTTTYTDTQEQNKKNTRHRHTHTLYTITTNNNSINDICIRCLQFFLHHPS